MDPQYSYTVLLDPQWIPSGSPVKIAFYLAREYYENQNFSLKVCNVLLCENCVCLSRQGGHGYSQARDS